MLKTEIIELDGLTVCKVVAKQHREWMKHGWAGRARRKESAG